MSEESKTTPNQERIQLNSGVNVLEIPVSIGKELSTHPMITPSKTEVVPGNKQTVISEIEDFFGQIESQGGNVIAIIEREYSSNSDEARHLDDVEFSKVQLVIVQK